MSSTVDTLHEDRQIALGLQSLFMKTLVKSPIRHLKKKYSRQNLLRFVECDSDLLTAALKGVKTRAAQGYCAFYGYLGIEFPLHYKAFRNTHDSELSAGHQVDPDFDLSSSGFINFIVDVGPIPSNLQNPILARIDQNKGFIRGNMKWVNEKKFRPISARRALAIANSHR